jgi:hypothetical protein
MPKILIRHNAGVIIKLDRFLYIISFAILSLIKTEGMAGNSKRGRDEGGSGPDKSTGTGRKSNSNRGFAAMDEEKQRQIASKGGKASHEKGTGHEFTSEEAREAARKRSESRSRS